MLPQFTQFPDLHRSHYLPSTNWLFIIEGVGVVGGVGRVVAG